MNRIPAAWNRISVGVIGLLLVLAGLAGIFSQVTVRPISGWIDSVDTESVDHAADASWWTWVLIGIAVLALVWGIRLLATIVRPQAVGALTLSDVGDDGRTVISPAVIADAVSAELSDHPVFSAVSVKALDDRGAKILRIVVTASPTRPYDDVVAAVSAAVEQVRSAVGGSDLHVQAMIEMDRVR